MGGVTVDEIVIRDRGRGPELAGTRVTVFDIIPWLRAGHHPTYIAASFGLSTPEVEALTRYIEEHKDEVMAINAKIEERIARGNPPEVEERLKKSHEKLMALKEQLLRQREQEASHEGAVGGHQHPGASPEPLPHLGG